MAKETLRNCKAKGMKSTLIDVLNLRRCNRKINKVSIHSKDEYEEMVVNFLSTENSIEQDDKNILEYYFS